MKLILSLSILLMLGCQSPQKSVFTGPVPPPAAPILRGVSSTASSSQCTQEPVLERPLVRSDYKTGEIMAICEAAIASFEEKLKAIVAVPARQRNFTNTMLAFENANIDFYNQYLTLGFMSSVSNSAEQRSESAQCKTRVGSYFSEVTSRKDLYLAMKDARGANAIERRLAKKHLRGFLLSGMNLPDDQILRMKELKQRESAIQTEFAQNLTNNADTLEFTRSELEGAPENFLQRLKTAPSGAFIVQAKAPDYIAIMENVKVGETRKKMLLLWENRESQKNLPLLNEVLQIRREMAKMLGYKTYAEIILEDRMAKNLNTVNSFMRNLQQKLASRNREEQSKLLAFKKELDPQASQLEPWDTAFLSTQLKKRDFNVDNEKVREYFPAEKVISGMLSVYSKVLDIDFVQVKNAMAWDPSVTLYEIRKKGSCDRQAYFYMDLNTRDAKRPGAAAATLIQGRQLPQGYETPVASIIANFNPPNEQGVTLLRHSEVETLFHEIGHIMHQTLTKVRFGSLAGAFVAWDFVEAPSQMLENWVWDPQTLDTMSGHYQDPTKKLPPELLAQMIKARDFGQAMFYSMQLTLANFDMTVHTSPAAVDLIETYKKTRAEVYGVPAIEGTNFPATFNHIVGGYAAAYYGYTWSEVYAADMFTRFERAPQRLLDTGVGKRYKERILEKGDSQEASELLRSFLGRRPNADAFNKSLGIQ